jgi:hypothetical protein
MAAIETERAITFEQPEMTTRLQLLPPHFRQARLGYDTSTMLDISRRWPTTEFKMAATETESGNNY